MPAVRYPEPAARPAMAVIAPVSVMAFASAPVPVPIGVGHGHGGRLA